MTTAALVRGYQQPRFLSRPEYDTTSGERARQLAHVAGLDLDPWQQTVLTESLGRRAADDHWSAFEVGLLVPRQNGKGTILEARELAGLFLFPDERLIIHSAHEFKTSVEAYQRVKSLVINTPVLDAEVRRYNNAHGEEGIELRDGSRLKFMARTGGAGRGFTADLLILDEAFNLPEKALAAMLPTLSARPNPQIWYTSSSGFPESEVLWRLLKRGRAGGDPHLAYFEWGCSPGAEPGDPEEWAKSNPALGYRIAAEHIARELFTMPPDQFARERLGVWEEAADAHLIDPVRWAGLTDPESATTGDAIYALDVSLDLKWAALGMAGRRADGLMHVSVDNRPSQGLAWVVPRCRQLSEQFGARFLLDRGGPAWSLAQDLEDAGVTVLEMSLPDVRQACGMFLDAVAEGRLRHRGQPDLDAAVLVARPRPVGEGGPVFGRKSGEITSLNAAAFAHWWAVSNSYDVLSSVM